MLVGHLVKLRRAVVDEVVEHEVVIYIIMIVRGAAPDYKVL
jgi:hypothetical protein